MWLCLWIMWIRDGGGYKWAWFIFVQGKFGVSGQKTLRLDWNHGALTYSGHWELITFTEEAVAWICSHGLSLHMAVGFTNSSVTGLKRRLWENSSTSASLICYPSLDHSPMETGGGWGWGEKIGPHLWKEEELRTAQGTGNVIIFGKYTLTPFRHLLSQCQRTAKQSFNSYISCIGLYTDSLVIST